MVLKGIFVLVILIQGGCHVQEQTGSLTGKGGLRLFYRNWTPPSPRGSIVLVHGMNEHSGRYQHVAGFFAGHGLAVYTLDQRGFGQSEGVRCYVDRFADYLHDLCLMVDLASKWGKPVMLGHSLGGLIAYRYGLTYPERISGLVLSSPLFRQRVKINPIQQALAPLLSAVLPRVQVPSNFDPDAVSRDPEVVRAYATDPLVWRKATPRWFMEFTRVALDCQQGSSLEMKLPVLFLQAGADRLVDPEATRRVYEQVPHGRKAFRLYPDKYHEILNDPGREEVLAEILRWLQEQQLI